MTAKNGINLIFGGAGFGVFSQSQGIDSHALAREQLQVLSDEGITTIDTSELYDGSEEELAYQKAPGRFIIHSKVKGGFAPGRDKDAIIKAGEERLRLLDTDQIDILHIHAPDNKTSIVEQVKAYDALHKKGIFKQLGLSNFSPKEVQEFYDVAKEHNCICPTVYQGAYSAVGRHPETELLPLLRRLGIAYNAYSPVAGGLLAKPKEDFLNGASRFEPSTFLGKMYKAIYNKPSFLRALDQWGEIADEADMPRAELAYRWVVYHSALKSEHGDGIVFGARDKIQLQDTLRMIQSGPLPEDVSKKADTVWDTVKEDATFDNWSGYISSLFQ